MVDVARPRGCPAVGLPSIPPRRAGRDDTLRSIGGARAAATHVVRLGWESPGRPAAGARGERRGRARRGRSAAQPDAPRAPRRAWSVRAASPPLSTQERVASRLDAGRKNCNLWQASASLMWKDLRWRTSSVSRIRRARRRIERRLRGHQLALPIACLHHAVPRLHERGRWAEPRREAVHRRRGRHEAGGPAGRRPGRRRRPAAGVDLQLAAAAAAARERRGRRAAPPRDRGPRWPRRRRARGARLRARDRGAAHLGLRAGPPARVPAPSVAPR